MFNSSRFEVARKYRCVNKSELAEKTGVDLRSITAYEREEYEPSPNTLASIAEVLNFPIEWFFLGDLHQRKLLAVGRKKEKKKKIVMLP